MLAVSFKHIWNMGSTRLAEASILLCVEVHLVIKVERIEEIATELHARTNLSVCCCPWARIFPIPTIIILFVPPPLAGKRGVPRGFSFAFQFLLVIHTGKLQPVLIWREKPVLLALLSNLGIPLPASYPVFRTKWREIS